MCDNHETNNRLRVSSEVESTIIMWQKVLASEGKRKIVCSILAIVQPLAILGLQWWHAFARDCVINEGIAELPPTSRLLQHLL